MAMTYILPVSQIWVFSLQKLLTKMFDSVIMVNYSSVKEAAMFADKSREIVAALKKDKSMDLDHNK